MNEIRGWVGLQFKLKEANEALTDSLVTSLVRGKFFLMRLNVLTDSLPKKITINRIHNAKHLHKTVIWGVPNHLLLLGCNK